MIKTQSSWQNICLRICFIMVITVMMGCQTGKHPEISDYRLQLGDLESIIQTGNWFKFQTDLRSDPYTCTLNPGRMASKGREYFILKFINQDKNFPFNLKDGDTLSLILDGRALHLNAYNVNKEQSRLSSYYEIDKWDMVDIGNASNVEAIIKSRDGELQTSFSNKNIYNYRYFSAKYILKTDDIPPLGTPEYEQPMAFFGGGAGTGVDFWFAYFTNLLHSESGLGDYFATGLGITTFKYEVYNQYPGHGYLWDGNARENNYNINGMYGLTYPSPFGNWSIEVGITYQYYFHDKSWNSKNSGTDLYPTYYQITDGNPREGSKIGMFIKLGGLWVQWNRNKLYAVGIAIPVPWW